MNNHSSTAEEDLDVEVRPGSHLHWIIWAYTSRVEIEGGSFNYLDYSTIDILDVSRRKALDRAASILPNMRYRVASVIEHYDRNPCN